MWQLSVLSTLILASACHTQSQQSYAGKPLANINSQLSDNPDTGLCGQRNPRSPAGARTNETHYAEFPWVVSIFLREAPPRSFANSPVRYSPVRLCVGSLIRAQVVLTAAHCVYRYTQQPEKLMIRAGEWDIEKRSDPIPYQDKSVTIIENHEEFTNGNCQNDFALLILSEPVILGWNVGLVCLPWGNTPIFLSHCFFNGWAKEKAGSYERILKKNEVPVFDYQSCQYALKRTPQYGPQFELHASLLCVSDKSGINSYEGDGGAPLVCLLPNTFQRYVQIGIVIGGTRCNGPGNLKFYANVAAGLNWIQKIISTHSRVLMG